MLYIKLVKHMHVLYIFFAVCYYIYVYIATITHSSVCLLLVNYCVGDVEGAVVGDAGMHSQWNVVSKWEEGSTHG